MYTVCACVRFSPKYGESGYFARNVRNTKRLRSRSLESVVAHLEHLALRHGLFLSGRRLQPFPPLVNRWAPAPCFLSCNFRHPASLTRSPRAERPQTPTKSGRDKGREPGGDYVTIWCCKQNIRFGENLTHVQTAYTKEKT